MTELYWAELGRLLLVWVFMISALNKVRAPAQFSESLLEDFHLPEIWAKPLSGLFMVLELVCVGLLFSPWLSWGLVLAAGLLVLFSAVIGKVVLAGEPVYCRCFGASENPLSWLDLLRNLIFLGAACYSLTTLTDSGSGLSRWDQLALAILALVLFQISIKLHELQQLLKRA